MISTIVINRLNGDTRRIRETHEDETGMFPVREINYEAPLDVTQATLDATLAANAIKVEASFAEQEIQQWIAEINSGLDPAHIDMGGFFVHSEPSHNTWEIAVDGAVTPFLQTEQPEHTQALVKIADLWGRLDNKEGEAIAGKPNDVASEIQIAVDAEAANVAYIPLIDEEGNPRA